MAGDVVKKSISKICGERAMRAFKATFYTSDSLKVPKRVIERISRINLLRYLHKILRHRKRHLVPESGTGN